MSSRSISMRSGLLLCALLLTAGAVAHSVTANAAPGETEDPSELRSIIDDRITFYNGQFRELQFVHVDGGKDWPNDMVAVITMLGDGADALDYEHPANLRAPLLEVSLERLRQFMRGDVVSATTFRIGTGSPIKRPNLCVITLNPDAYFTSDYETTRYMFDLPPGTMGRVHHARYLDHIRHLEFALDHEAFHCLDSYLYGGTPRTHEEFGGEYNEFRRESIADAFAMAMHLKLHGRITRYARNIALARVLWMFSGTPNSDTFDTIRELLRYNPRVLHDTAIEEIFELAAHLRDKTVGDYNSYLVHRASTLTAARLLGKPPGQFGQVWEKIAARKTSAAHVQFLVNRYRYYHSQLFTDTPIPLEAPTQPRPYTGPVIQ